LQRTDYARKCEETYWRLIIATASLVLFPALLLITRGKYLLSALGNSHIIVHLCHFLGTTIPSLFNALALLIIIISVLMVPTGLFRGIFHFFRGATSPVEFASSLFSTRSTDLRPFDFVETYPVVRIQSRIPFAYAGGLLRKKIFISDSTEELLSSEEIKGTLLHEAGHLAMNHPVKRLVIKAILFGFFMIPTRKEIWQRFKMLTELAADEFAVRKGAAPVCLASAMVKVAKSTSHAFEPAAAGFSDSLISLRVRNLLGEKDGVPSDKKLPSRRKPVRKVAAVALFSVLLSFPFLYHTNYSSCAAQEKEVSSPTTFTPVISFCTEMQCSKCDKCVK